MAKQTFTTGQVLTAAQVNSLQSNDFNQTVSVKTAAYTLVAADKGTRIEFNTSGSVTCTVNTGLFDAGDTLVIQNRGVGVVTVTAGTATVNTSATLALSQYDAGTLYFISASAAIFFNTDAGGGSPLTTKGDLYGFSTVDARIPIGANNTVLTADSTESLGLKWAAASSGALTKINRSTFSGVSSGSISNCFSATYDNYLIIFADFVNSTGDCNFDFFLRTGSTNATANYLGTYYDNNAGTVSGFTLTSKLGVGFHNTNKGGGHLWLQSPFLTRATTYQQSMSGSNFPRIGGGVHTSATSFESFGFTISAATSSGEITVYGLSI